MNHRTPRRPGLFANLSTRSPIWIGAVLLALWAVVWIGFKIVSGLIHLLLVVGVAILAWGLVQKGARALKRPPGR